MLVLSGIGRVTADLEPQKSPKNGTDYLRFNVAVNKGGGDQKRTVFIKCLLYGEQQIQRMIDAKVKKGTLISFTGEFDVEEYTKEDGTKGKNEKVKLYTWGFISSSGKPKDETAAPEDQGTTDNNENDNTDIPF